MTKPLVQGQIGYWVNGELIHMPKKRPSSKSNSPETAYLTRNREREEELNALDAWQCQMNSLEPMQNFVKGLQNASKSGNIESVWYQLTCIQSRIRNPNPYMVARAMGFYSTSFRLLVGYIFLPDNEGRTALHYASLGGHSHIVELYLSLYLVSAIHISKANTGAAYYTFRKWFSTMNGMCKLQLTKNFTLEDYDVCIRNALNNRVRHTLTRQKVTIRDVITTLTKRMDGNAHVDSMSMWHFINGMIYSIEMDMDRMTRFLRNKEKTKSKKPMLKYDALNDLYEDDDLWTEEDYYVDTSSHTECVAYNDETMSNDEQVDTKDKYVRDEISTNSDLSIASSNHIEQNFDVSIASSNIIDEGNFVEVEDIVKHADSTADFSFLNCAASIDFSQISLEELHVDDGGEDEETTVGWDVVSDLQSVNSIGTSVTTVATGTDKAVLQPSTPYRDMLLKAGKTIVCNDEIHTMKVPRAAPTVNAKRTTKGSENMAAILEESDLMNDAHWERDGFKNGRGGKLENLFRRKDRTFKPNKFPYGKHYGLGIPSKQQRCLRNSCRKMVK